MIRATADMVDGGKLVLLGLSKRNLELLAKERPIMIAGSTMDIPFDIIVFAGEDEAAMIDQLKEFIGPGTKFTVLGKPS